MVWQCVLTFEVTNYTVEHSNHLALMFDIGSCFQQSLDCLGVSFRSSYLQRNIAILYESIRDKKTVITSGNYCVEQRERERERS